MDPLQLERVGLIAGRGHFPLEMCREIRRSGVPHLGVIAMNGETSPEIEALASRVDWFHVGQVSRAIRALKRQDIRHLLFAGQIRPGRLFHDLRPDLRTLLLLRRLKERNAETIFGALADEFEKEGIHVLPSTTYMGRSLADAGVLGAARPTAAQWEDIRLGERIARETSRLDIGQTVVVKRGTVVAVEAFEGTDRAIRRAGSLAGKGTVVVKVAKPGHDMRFDVPCVGMGTVESLQTAESAVIALHAGRTLIIERAKVVAALDRLKVAVVGLNIEDDSCECIS